MPNVMNLYSQGLGGHGKSMTSPSIGRGRIPLQPVFSDDLDGGGSDGSSVASERSADTSGSPGPAGATAAL